MSKFSVNLIVSECDYNSHIELFEQPSFVEKTEIDEVPLVHLEYYDVEFGVLNFEQALVDCGIPYDKTWSDRDDLYQYAEYFRVLPNGTRSIKHFENDQQLTIELDKVVKALEDGTIQQLIDKATEERYVVSWAEQIITLDCRRATTEYLRQLCQDELDDLVVEMVCEQACDAINSTPNESEKEELICLAETAASDINNQGRDVQIDYLLKHGFKASN